MAKPKYIDDREQLEKLAPMLKAPIKRQVFVCTGKSCSQVGGQEVFAEFDRLLTEKGLRQGKESKGRNPIGEIVLTQCGSIGFCSIGTAVMVYPDGTMYGQVQPEDAAEIVEEHLEKGKLVERLALMELECQQERELIAEKTIFAVDKDGREFDIRLMIGKPYQKAESLYGEWACPVAMVGYHGVFPDMVGVDSWQALQLARTSIQRLLGYFIEDGGKLYVSKEEAEELTVDEVFSGKSLSPRPDRELSQDEQARVDQLSDEELSFIDRTIIESTSNQWRKVARVVGATISATPDRLKLAPDIFYAKRVAKLVSEGKLESQGDLNNMRFSEVRLPKNG